MKLHVTPAAGQNLFTGYGAGYVSINGERYDHSVLVSPDRAVERWDPPGFDALTASHFQALLATEPEIVIVGTGETLRFPGSQLTRVFGHARVGFEVMDSKAACRTYNILVAEGRRVLAAILL